MVEGILVDILKSGTVAFIGTKITKAISQKEISEIIAGSGWAVVGVDLVKLLIPIIKGIEGFFDKVEGMFDRADKLMEGLSRVPFLGKVIERGIDSSLPH